jgi:hypothetical protein
MLSLRATMTALVATLVLPGAAAQARTFTLAKGYSPAVAVEKDGTGHFAWFQDGGKIDKLRYCQVPRGHTACEKTHVFTGTGDASYRNWRPFVFVKGQEVTLVATFDRPQAAPVVNDHLVFQSDNGGKTFTGPIATGDPDRSGPEDAVTDGSNVGLIGEGMIFSPAFLGGPAEKGRSADLSELVKQPDRLGDPSIALVDNKEPIVTADDRDNTVVFHPPGLTMLRSVQATSWQQAPTLVDEIQASLAGGPDGVYAMLISTPNGKCPCKHVFRRWTGTKFGPRFDTQQDFKGTGASTGGNHDLFEDGSGRLHAVWTKTHGGAAQDPTDIRYARSPGGTSDFSKPITLAERGKNKSPLDLDVGTASDGKGFVAWEEPGSTSSGSKSVVRATAVAPTPDK